MSEPKYARLVDDCVTQFFGDDGPGNSEMKNDLVEVLKLISGKTVLVTFRRDDGYM